MSANDTSKIGTSNTDSEKGENDDQNIHKLKNGDYQNDTALTTIKDDRFKHSHYVKVLKGILEKCETPFNVGLYGKWGVGKSSIVHMLQEELKEKPKDYKYVEVNAWGLSRDSLQQGILEEINSQLGKVAIPQQEIEDDLYNIREVESINRKKTLQSFTIIFGIATSIIVILSSFNPENILNVVSAVGISSIIVALISLIKSFMGSSKRIIPKTVSSLQFQKIYQKLVNTQKGKKFIVVIDNLDRCDDRVAVDLLGIIQTFMVKKNCINILACDDDAIIKHLRGVKGQDYSERDGNEFLSKFFQLTLRIPPFIGENLEKYANELIQNRSITFDNFVKPILISGAIENPRKINQFMNNAVALYHLAKLKEKDKKLPNGIITKHTDFLVKMIVIRHEWPSFHKELEKEPGLINDVEKRKEWIAKSKDPQIEKLEKFLETTDYSKVDDGAVSAFLRLNQESYSAETGIDEFSNAVISKNVPVVTKLFESIKPEQQNQYMKKLEELTKRPADKNDASLLICTYSIIAIIDLIKDESQKPITVALLGRHLSGKLLSSLDKFDLSKHNLFRRFEEMQPHFSKPIYEKIISSAFIENEINKTVLEMFFENSETISNDTMSLLTDSFVVYSNLHEQEVLNYIAHIFDSYDWTKIKVPKPRFLLDCLINRIKFDVSEIDNNRINTYIKIHQKISEEEQEKMIEYLASKIQECSSGSQVVFLPLLNMLDSLPIQDDKSLLNSSMMLYKSLSGSLRSNPDHEQKKSIINLLIKFKPKLKGQPGFEDCQDTIHDGLKTFLEEGDQETLTWFNSLADSNNEFLHSEVVLQGYLYNMENTSLGNPDILKFALSNVFLFHRELLIEKISGIVCSDDPAKYQQILKVLTDEPSAFDDNLNRAVISSCKSLSLKMEYPTILEMDTAIVKLYKDLDLDSIESICQRAIELICKDEPSMQDDGLGLLTIINDKTGRWVNLIGIEKSIEMAEKLISENNESAKKYLDFIAKYRSRLDRNMLIKTTDLLKLSFQAGTSANIHNMTLDCILHNPELISSVFEEVIKLAENPYDGTIKEKCRQVLTASKDHLFYHDKKRAEDILDNT